MTFEEYVLARGPALVRLAHALTGDVHLAEDLAQETLARVHLRWGRVSRTDHPDAYVRRMLVNALTSWRRRRSSTEVPVAETADAAGAQTAGPQEQREGLWQLLGRLPTRQRAVLVLRFYEDLDDAAIARVLDCSAGTVRAHASRALATLRAGGDDAPAARLEEKAR